MDARRRLSRVTIRMPSAIETHHTADFDFRKEIVEKFLCHRLP
jgi:hypothetical protein